MSEKNLSEFFMTNRPTVQDLYVICDSVLKILNSTGCVEHIIFNPEYIDYDRKRKKIRFKENCRISQDPRTEVLHFFVYIRNECRYAGDEIHEFAEGLLQIYGRSYKNDSGLSRCRKFLERYRKKEDIGYMILLIAGVAAVETVLRLL